MENKIHCVLGSSAYFEFFDQKIFNALFLFSHAKVEQGVKDMKMSYQDILQIITRGKKEKPYSVSHEEEEKNSTA